MFNYYWPIIFLSLAETHSIRYTNFVNYFPSLEATLPNPDISYIDDVSQICHINRTAGIYRENAYARIDLVSNDEHCLNICFNDEQCFSVTYQRVLNICVLHDNVAESDDQIAELGCDETFYSSLLHCPTKEHTYKWLNFMEDFKTLRNNVLSMSNGNSADTENVSEICGTFENAGYYKENAYAWIEQGLTKQNCLSICYNDEQCLSFTYQSEDSICILHNKTADPNYKLYYKDSNDVSYTRIQNCPKKYPSCGNITDSAQYNYEQQCGVPSEQFSVRNISQNSSEAAPHSYPWMAHLYLRSRNIICGGILISKDIVVTTADCLSHRRNVDEFIVYLGLHERIKIGDCQSAHKIAKFVRHPQYTEFDGRYFFMNDIALIKLANPIKFFNDYIRPACLPANNQSAPSNKETCVAIGWWLTESANDVQLQQLMLPLLNDSQCLLYNNVFYSDGQFCAGTRNRQDNKCTGESGSPFMCDEDGRFIVYGLNSYQDLDYRWSFNTKVSAYLDWIEETRKTL